jgi:hypothetical protein
MKNVLTCLRRESVGFGHLITRTDVSHQELLDLFFVHSIALIFRNRVPILVQDQSGVTWSDEKNNAYTMLQRNLHRVYPKAIDL